MANVREYLMYGARLLAVIGFLAWLAQPGRAAVITGARSLPANCATGGEVEISLTFTIDPSAAAPASVTVVEQLPVGWTIDRLHSRNQPSHFDSATGVAQWAFVIGSGGVQWANGQFDTQYTVIVPSDTTGSQSITGGVILDGAPEIPTGGAEALQCNATCGNGILELGEECDEGRSNGGCCSKTCLFLATTRCRGAVYPSPQAMTPDPAQVQGWEFTVERKITVSGLGVYDAANSPGAGLGDGLVDEHEVAIWDTATPNQPPIALAIVPAGTAAKLGLGGARYTPIPPVVLKAGGKYVIAARYPTTADAIVQQPGRPGTCSNDASQVCWELQGCGTGNLCLGHCENAVSVPCALPRDCPAGDVCLQPFSPAKNGVVYVDSRQESQAATLVLPRPDGATNHQWEFGPTFVRDGCQINPQQRNPFGGAVYAVGAVAWIWRRLRRLRPTH